jgi:hypothetical protein
VRKLARSSLKDKHLPRVEMLPFCQLASRLQRGSRFLACLWIQLIVCGLLNSAVSPWLRLLMLNLYMECGRRHQEVRGNDGYSNPNSWCSQGKAWFDRR